MAMSKKAHTYYKPVFVLALLLFINSLTAAWEYIKDHPTIDFFAWWVVPHELPSKYITNIYSTSGQEELAKALRQEFETSNASQRQKELLQASEDLYNGKISVPATPFFYAAFSLLVSDNYEYDQGKFIILSLACFILSILILCRLLKYSYIATVLLASIFISYYRPFISDLTVGNINQIQLLMLSFFILLFVFSDKFFYSLCAGFVLGTAVMLKPNILMVLPFIVILSLFERQFKEMFSLLLGFFLSAVLSFLTGIMYFRDSNIWMKWLSQLPHTLASYPIESGNASLAKILFILTNLKFSVFIYLLIIFVFIYAILSSNHKISSNPSNLKSTQRFHDKKKIAGAFITTGFGCGSLLLGSEYVWLHYYTLLIPLIIFLIRPIYDDNNRIEINFTNKFFAFSAFTLFTEMIYGIFSKSVINSAILVVLGTIILLGSATYEMKEQALR